MTIGERIKNAREKANMTQAELAQKLSISFQSVSQWERDVRKPKKETLASIANALGVDPLALSDDLFDNAFLSALQRAFGSDDEFRTAFLDGNISLALLRSDNDLRLMQGYGMLNESGQRLAINYVWDLAEKAEYVRDIYRLTATERKKLQQNSTVLPYPSEDSTDNGHSNSKKGTPQD